MYKIGAAYDMPSYPVDGMQPETVHAAIYEAVEKARNNEGPTFLEIRTYRYRGHSMSDPAKYRTKEEVDEYKERDPISLVLKTIKENGFATDEEIAAIDNRLIAVVDESVKFAEESPWPDADELLKDVYMDADYPYIVD